MSNTTLTQFPAGQTQYKINFDYLARPFVVVTLVNSNDAAQNRVLTAGNDYRFLNPTTIEIIASQTGFDILQIHRFTSTDLLVEFRNGSVLTAGDLTNAELQAIHISEEGRDQTTVLAKQYAEQAVEAGKDAKDIYNKIVKLGTNGYTPVGSFEAGGTVSLQNDALQYGAGTSVTFWRWEGSFPKTVAPGSSPMSAGGIGHGAWIDVTDATLRGQLADPAGYGLIGEVQSVEQLRTISGRMAGEVILLSSYYSTGKVAGGGRMVWTLGTATDDGGYTIVPTAQTLGFWRRDYSGLSSVRLTDFGAKGDEADMSAAIRSVLRVANLLGKRAELDIDYRAQDIKVSDYSNVFIHGRGKGKLVDGCNKVLFSFTNCNGLYIDAIDVDGNRMNQTSTTQTGTPDGIGLIVVTNCSNWVIEHCNIHDNRLGAAVIIMDNGTNTSTNWEGSEQNGFLHKNYIHDNGVAGVVMSDGVFSWSHSTVIDSNVIRRCTDYGVALDYSQRSIVRNNIISDVLVVAGVLGVRDCLIDGNNFEGAELGIAVTLSGQPAVNPYISRNVTIVNNKGRNINSSTLLGDGIYVDPSAENVIVENNTISTAKRGYSIPCARATVVGNVAIDCVDTSFYIDVKRGYIGANSSYTSDGGAAAKSYISGQASRQVLHSGVSRVTVAKSVGQSDVRICDVSAISQYAAAFVTIKFAGLINSLGPVAASQEFIITKSLNVYTVVLGDGRGDTTNVKFSVDTSGPVPGITARFSNGAITPSVFLIDIESPGDSDSIMYVTAQ